MDNAFRAKQDFCSAANRMRFGDDSYVLELNRLIADLDNARDAYDAEANKPY